MSNEVFTQLVDAHYTALYRFALSLARNGADAGDLVQQTFFIWATKGASLTQAMTDGVNQILFGRAPVDSLDQLTKDWRANGGDQIRSEYEAQLARSTG